jgi:4-amino-4-deoxychorismate lyase
MSRTLVNGREAVEIDARDRGLHYGDGLFETIALVAGEPRRLELHVARLARGCARLGIACPPHELLEQELARLAGEETRGVLKLIVTRGIGARGFKVDADAPPTRILSLHPWPNHPPQWASEGVAVRICQTSLADQPALAGIKHLNRLEQVVARREWNDPAIAEGLMRDRQGAFVCGTMTNMFIVRDGRLLTPAVDRCGVAGTMRAAVLERAHALGIPAVQSVVTEDELERADEVFLTNALIGVWPVTRIERRTLSIGPLTQRLRAEVE